MRKLRLTRDVTVEECSWLDEDLKKGKVVYKYSGYTYGCVSSSGIAVTEKEGINLFFQIPKDALEEIEK